MSYTNEQALEEEHQDTIDFLAEEWENERKWFEGLDTALIEVIEAEMALLPAAEINFEVAEVEVEPKEEK